MSHSERTWYCIILLLGMVLGFGTYALLDNFIRDPSEKLEQVYELKCVGIIDGEKIYITTKTDSVSKEKNK